MSCGNPPAISNGKLNFTGTSYNDTAHYTCDNGYNLNTEFAVKRCTAKKRWSGLTPRCCKLFYCFVLEQLCPHMHLVRCSPNFDIQHEVSLKV